MKYTTCMASWFWLSTQRNKGMWGQRNSEEIGMGATRNRLHGQVAFLSSPNACVRIIPFGSECSPANQIGFSHRRLPNFGNLLWESSNWLNNNLLRKTKSKYQRSVDRSVVNLEYSMEKQGNCIEAWTGNGLLRRDVMAILSSSKTCRIAISSLKSIVHVDDQISEKLSLSCTAMELKFALRKSTSTFSITRCLRITHYIEQFQWLWLTNRTQ